MVKCRNVLNIDVGLVFDRFIIKFNIYKKFYFSIRILFIIFIYLFLIRIYVLSILLFVGNIKEILMERFFFLGSKIYNG